MCNCCWHVDPGPSWIDLPPGHVLQRCCRCKGTRSVHRDHTWGQSRNRGHVSLDVVGRDGYKASTEVRQ